MHRVLAYAVRKKRLEKNPLSKRNLPEGWSPAGESPRRQSTPDPSAAPSWWPTCSWSPATSAAGQGPRFVAFFGCMFYAMMRPAEVTSLTKDALRACRRRAGDRLIILRFQPGGAGRDFTDDWTGPRGPRPEGTRPPGPRREPAPRRARRATRNVPIPPELVTLLREHIAPVRHRTGRAPVPQRERQPDSALDLLARLAEGPRDGPYPRAARHSPAAPALRPAPLRSHLAAELPQSQPPRSRPGPDTAWRC